MNQLVVLNPENPIYIAISHKFKKYICDAKKNFVWCCQDGKPASESELEILKEFSASAGKTFSSA